MDTVDRFVFKECRNGKHEDCSCWMAGEVDGKLRAAGCQCACDCHKAVGRK